ncbi:hypothetical protein MLD38_033497 [Melastoma candidum]|uniref:Uncharacterized protein n=1 Tax=Melastoma candidum TaxID=119954 RepID=A0ACB9M930_9MYRT|nr:hypothetical protein MLD38_033497 [Melastoma candidum]
MSFSKPSFVNSLKPLPLSRRFLLPIRSLSFSTPEEAAAERRRRKRRLRIEPPLSNRPGAGTAPRPPSSIPQNPNSPKLPEPVSALTGKRLDLHNRILTLLRQEPQPDLTEAALLTRHSIYSNCRPTIFTANSVLASLLRHCQYSDFLALHRFITQANVAPNVITYNLLFQLYMDCRKPDTALEHYKQFINEAPINPSLATYRVMIKGLVDNDRFEKAMELKEEMSAKGFKPDPVIYHYLMSGCVKNGNSDGVFELYEELKEKVGGEVVDGVVIGGLMKGYFLKGMEEEAMQCYQEIKYKKMTAVAYNSVLDALKNNGKFEDALKLFDEMLKEHEPPKRLSVNLGSFNVIVDGYCRERKFEKAIETFRRMEDYKCVPDDLSYNVLIEQLCKNGMLERGEELSREMSEKRVNPDEYTYSLLMDACIENNRPDDAVGYFKKMIDSGLRPNQAVYDRLVAGLVQSGKVDEAKSLFDIMVKKLKMNVAGYQFMMKSLSDVGRLDDVLKIVDEMLDEEARVLFNEDFEEFVKGELRKGGREDDLAKLVEEKERLKAEAKAREIAEMEEGRRRQRESIELAMRKTGIRWNKDGEGEGSKDAEVISASGGEDSAGDSTSTSQELQLEVEHGEQPNPRSPSLPQPPKILQYHSSISVLSESVPRHRISCRFFQLHPPEFDDMGSDPILRL